VLSQQHGHRQATCCPAAFERILGQINLDPRPTTLERIKAKQRKTRGDVGGIMKHDNDGRGIAWRIAGKPEKIPLITGKQP
jgi:hypothetical protein